MRTIKPTILVIVLICVLGGLGMILAVADSDHADSSRNRFGGAASRTNFTGAAQQELHGVPPGKGRVYRVDQGSSGDGN